MKKLVQFILTGLVVFTTCNLLAQSGNPTVTITQSNPVCGMGTFQLAFDLNRYSPGLYYFRVLTDNGSVLLKVLKE